MYIATPFYLQVELNSKQTDSVYYNFEDSVFFKKDEKVQKRIEKGNKVSNFILEFVSFDTGKFTFPQVKFYCKSEDKIDSFTSKEKEITILSVISDTSKNLYDIAPVKKMKYGMKEKIFPFALLALILILFFGIKKYLKFRKNKASCLENEIEIDLRQPWEIAFEMLNILKAKNYPTKNLFIEYYFELSYILKFMIEKIYGINAIEMTTSEIQKNLKIKNHLEKSEILTNLDFADRVKFAKFTPSSSQGEETYNWLNSYILKIKNISEKKNKINEEKNV